MELPEPIESPLELIPNMGAPDRVLKENGRLVIHPETVVVRDSDSNTISRYKDDIWETTHYGTYGNIHFKKFGSEKDTVKRLCYASLMSAQEATRVSTANVALAAYAVYDILAAIFVKLSKNVNTFEKALLDKDFIYDAVNSMENSRMSRIRQVLRIINIIGTDVGITLVMDNERENLIEAKKRLHDKKQHPAIPFEIYSNLFSQRWAHFENIEKDIANLANFIKLFATNTYFGREQQSKKYKRLYATKLITFKQATKQYRLVSLFKKYGVTNSKNFPYFITGIFATLAQLISQLTGMRTGELKRLQQGCYIPPNQKRPPLIKGLTSKKYGGIPKPQEWITHYDAARIVSVLQQLGSALLEGINLQKPDEKPLFVGSSYTDPQKRNISLHYNHKVVPSLSSNDELPLNNDNGQLTLTQDMMDNFLKKIDQPGRWDNDTRIVVGEQWRPTTHQNRRTFALLAINSGLVSYASLKGQLAQTSMLMAAYYGNGATNIDPIITDGDHVVDDIQKQREEQATLAVCLHLINGTMNIKKEVSEWENDEMEKDISDPVNFIEEYNNTLKEIQKGNLSARPTPIGWCKLIGRCDSFLTFTFLACGDCDSAVRDEDRINNSIEMTDSFILDLIKEGYDKSSIAMRSAVKEKEYLLRQKEKTQQEQSDEL